MADNIPKPNTNDSNKSIWGGTVNSPPLPVVNANIEKKQDDKHIIQAISHFENYIDKLQKTNFAAFSKILKSFQLAFIHPDHQKEATAKDTTKDDILKIVNRFEKIMSNLQKAQIDDFVKKINFVRKEDNKSPVLEPQDGSPIIEQKSDNRDIEKLVQQFEKYIEKVNKSDLSRLAKFSKIFRATFAEEMAPYFKDVQERPENHKIANMFFSKGFEELKEIASKLDSLVLETKVSNSISKEDLKEKRKNARDKKKHEDDEKEDKEESKLKKLAQFFIGKKENKYSKREGGMYGGIMGLLELLPEGIAALIPALVGGVMLFLIDFKKLAQNPVWTKMGKVINEDIIPGAVFLTKHVLEPFVNFLTTNVLIKLLDILADTIDNTAKLVKRIYTVLNSTETASAKFVDAMKAVGDWLGKEAGVLVNESIPKDVKKNFTQSKGVQSTSNVLGDIGDLLSSDKDKVSFQGQIKIFKKLMKDTMSSYLGFIKDADDRVDEINKAMGQQPKNDFWHKKYNIWKTIEPTFDKGYNRFVSIIQNSWSNHLKNVDIKNRLHFPDMITPIEGFFNRFKHRMSADFSLTEDVAKKLFAATSEAKNAIVSGLTYLINFSKNKIETAYTGMKTGFNDISDGFSDILSSIKVDVKNIYNSISVDFSKWFDALIENISGINIKEKAKSAFDYVEKQFFSIVDSLVNDFENVFKTISNLVTSIPKAIENFIKITIADYIKDSNMVFRAGLEPIFHKMYGETVDDAVKKDQAKNIVQKSPPTTAKKLVNDSVEKNVQSRRQTSSGGGNVQIVNQNNNSSSATQNISTPASPYSVRPYIGH